MRTYLLTKRAWAAAATLSFLVYCLSSGLAAESGPAAKPLEVQGDFMQGGIIFGRAKSDEEIWIGAKQLRLSPDGHFVFGLDRDQASPVVVTLVDSEGKSTAVSFEVAPRDYDIQRIEGVAQKHVSPPAQVLSRIANEAAKVRLARTRDDDRADFLQAFIWPLEGPITGVYGSQRVYNGVPKSPHYGVDIAAPKGAAVQAPAAGIVTLAEPDLYYSGGTLIVDHGHGLSSTFIHLSKLLVDVGERVDQGEVIAEVGSTGRSTGPHLDWRMNWFDVRVDPQLLMSNASN